MLDDAFKPGSNALNSLRIFFAMAVIVAHCWPIGGFGNAPRLGDFDSGLFAVAAFFVASGYLVTASRERSSLARFGWARFLRVYPGFWICLLAIAFVFAPISGIFRGGWSISEALGYVIQNLSLDMRKQEIGTTLNGAPFPGAWDGSLWTLFYEFACYVLVGLLLTVGRFRQAHWLLTLFVISTVAALFRHLEYPVTDGGQLISGGSIARLMLLLPFFVAGSVIYRYRRKIPMSVPIFVLSSVLVLGATACGWGTVVGPLPLAYMVMWLGAVLPQGVERLRSGDIDISYGIYIYAFPVQQIVVLAGFNRYGVVFMIFASILATIPLAVFSWYLVEKPCLRLKAIQSPSIDWPLRPLLNSGWRSRLGRCADQKHQHSGATLPRLDPRGSNPSPQSDSPHES